MKLLYQGNTMKNLLAFLVMSVALALTGCIVGSGNSTLTSVAVTTTTQTYPGSLSGQIFDATTGLPISGVGLTIELVQGSIIRTPDTLITAATDPLAGQYGFANIPVESTAMPFKLVVSVPHYQPFESEFSFGGATTGTNATTGGSAPFYSKIGNVYLYPLGVSASNVTINVTDSYANAVSGVTVDLFQYVAGNTPIMGTNATGLSAASAVANLSPSTLAPTTGLTTSAAGLTAVTNPSGIATFFGTNLALGAQYYPVALGTTANGFNLQTTTGAQLIAGSRTPAQVIVMQPLTTAPSLAEVARSFVVGQTAPLASGILNVIFNQAFTLPTANWSAVLTYTNASGVIANVPAASAAVTAVSAVVAGPSLQLTPSFSAPIPTGTSGVYITYTYPGVVYTTSTGQYNRSIFNSNAATTAVYPNATFASGVVGASSVAAGGSVQLN